MTDEGTWLLNLLDNAEVTSEELSKMQREMKHPFIVIEGMDCTGKLYRRVEVEKGWK